MLIVLVGLGLVGVFSDRLDTDRVSGTDDDVVLDVATVVVVIDGDTIELDIGGTTERVRLIGIDTPETVSPSVPDQCYGAEASAALTELLPPGTEVTIERDREARDRYGRLLLYVTRRSDDLAVNLWLVSNGFADVVIYPPNDSLEGPLLVALADAQAQPIGLWAHCDGPDQPLE